jgi:hypothetical protein
MLLYTKSDERAYLNRTSIRRSIAAPVADSSDAVAYAGYWQQSCGFADAKPRDAEVGTTFRKAMETLNSRSKEWIWTPYSDLPGNPSTTGDEGVDFVVWKETLDQRNGRLFVIGQCACGDDWADKFNDVSLPRLRKWFHPLSFAEPVRALASPRHIATDWLNEALGSAGLVFDRARLVMIGDSAGVGAHLLASKAKFAELTNLVLKASGSLALIEAAKKTKLGKNKVA